jgi:hypothetical protein
MKNPRHKAGGYGMDPSTGRRAISKSGYRFCVRSRANF